MKQSIMTVLGRDRSGIIGKVTGVLYREGCNLEDVSMTILEGEFAMIVVLSHAKKNFAQVQRSVQKAVKPWKLAVFGKDLKGHLKRGEKHQVGSKAFLISVVGQDQTGIVFKTSRLLAKHKLNITDLNSKILGQGKNAMYALMLEVDIPKKFKLTKIERELKAMSRQTGLEVRMKSVERLAL